MMFKEPSGHATSGEWSGISAYHLIVQYIIACQGVYTFLINRYFLTGSLSVFPGEGKQSHFFIIHTENHQISRSGSGQPLPFERTKSALGPHYL